MSDWQESAGLCNMLFLELAPLFSARYRRRVRKVCNRIRYSSCAKWFAVKGTDVMTL